MLKLPGIGEMAGRARAWLQRAAVAIYFGAAVLCVTSVQESSAQAIDTIVSQTPLSAGGNVPGNLLLTPSVEFPTMDSMANLGNYDVTRTYTGYFDSGKCYTYVYSSIERESYFNPTSTTETHACSGATWSGNYLNWAATQTIDPFRKALTGGYRVQDTTTETWLEKARSDSNATATYFPDRRTPGSGSNTTLVAGATPATGWSNIWTSIMKRGNKMVFTQSGDTNNATPVRYDPSIHTPAYLGNHGGTVYEVSIRVKVCVPGLLEPNCVQYGSNYKPEGLIQKYSTRIRFSAFGYLNDDTTTRDGGVLRARQKFVGDKKLNPATGLWEENANREWSPTTGILVENPDGVDADATTSVVAGGSGYSNSLRIRNSGVINYINKFGQSTTSTKLTHKSYDPVSELYYTVVRYLKHQDPVPQYSNLTGSAQTRHNLADAFPVITDWDDPIQYRCQNNAILGIGDVYTHRDKNLPGYNPTDPNEPAKPSQVSGDTTVDVVAATRTVADREGITISTPFPITAGQGSAFIAGLAYDAHVNDIRPDLDDKQTASTYWVDVREGQTLRGPPNNQYWLAAKYGGFEVPENFDPSANTALNPGLWSSGETLATVDGSYLRPENFYVASEAEAMVQSLTRAFAKIAAEGVGSAASLAANSTRLETDTRTFQAQFNKGSWHGELNAYTVDANGALVTPEFWKASEELPAWEERNILANANGSLVEFEYDELTPAQQGQLGTPDVVNYLRGDRSKEESEVGGTLRTRRGVLGDIVNSTPVYVGSPNARLYSTASFAGAADFGAYAASKTGRANRLPIVYVGANDGMLHAFDADTGAEVFAFVPSTVIANGLRNYSSPEYEHQYFVDGEIAVADIYDTGSSSWKTVLVGTLGRGGPGIFALDVTNPGAPSLLWEHNGSTIAALGKNIGRPVIAQVANGDWRVLLGNGPGSTAGRAQLISIRLGGVNNGVASAAVVPDATTGNGLTAPLARDTAGPDGFADTVYAGDLQGNLWKFSGIAGSPTVTKLFQARDPDGVIQPITAAPLVGRNPQTGDTWVFFGTGRYLHETDLNSSQVQTWYGLKDKGTLISGRGSLVQRDITAEVTIGAQGEDTPDESDDVAGTLVRAIEQGNAAEMGSKDGWYIDLVSPVNGAEGERMVVPNRFQGAALIGTTRIPEQNDPCSPGGRGFVMAIDPFTGARLNITFFDVNGDGLFNEADMICDGDSCVPASGIGFDSSPNNPIFIEDVMQVGLDDGTTRVIRTQGSSVQATRMSWRELLN